MFNLRSTCADPKRQNPVTEIWIHAHVLGTPQYGSLKAIDTVTPSSCSNSTAINCKSDLGESSICADLSLPTRRLRKDPR